MKNSFIKLLGAALMISGITIGIGILGLPVDTGLAGLIPSIIVLLIAWLFMLATGWIIAKQITQSPNNKEDLGGLFTRTLGKPGTILTNIGYLSLLYCLLIAHIVGGAQILESLEWVTLPTPVFILIFFIVATSLGIIASKQIEKASMILLFIIVVIFAIMIIILLKHIDPTRLAYSDWHYTISVIPIVLVAVAFQIIIPTVSKVLNHDFKSVMIAIIIGTSIPVIINIIWMIAVLGALPLTGEDSILSAYLNNEPAIIPLSNSHPETSIKPISLAFSLIVLVLSFVLQATSMISYFNDFLSKKYGKKSYYYSKLLTFIPAIAIALLFPDIFLSILDITGGFSIVLICGLLPALVGLKYYWNKGLAKRWAMLFLLIIFLFFLAVECLQEFGFLKIDPNAEYFPTRALIEKSIQN